MPEFVITTPDGRKFKVTGPNREGALAAVKKQVETAQEPSLASDLGQSAMVGLRRGGEFLLGMPGDVNQMTLSAASRVARALFGENAGQAVEAVRERAPGFTTPDVQAATKPFLGPEYEPKTRPGRYTRSVMEQVPGAIAGPGRWVGKGLQALGAGIGSEAAGEATEGTQYEPWARAGGAIVGGGGAGMAARPAQTSRDAIHDANVALLEREGVPLTAGQQTGSSAKKYIESELGGSAFDTAIDRQRSAFTDAAMRRLGEAGGSALPEDLVRARARIGGEFDRLSGATALPFDQTLQNRLLNSTVDYQEVAPAVAPVVENMMNRMAAQAADNGGFLTGAQYREHATKLRELEASTDVPTGQALGAFRDTLDDAIERSLSGPDLAEWQAARRQYANLMTVSRAMTGGGVEAASGQISPVRLRSAISGGGNGPAAIAEGRSTMTDLANAGVGLMKDMPQSGTAPRLAARAIPATVAGGVTGAATGDPFSAAALAAGGMFAGPEIMGRAVMSPLGQSALLGPDENQRLLLAALLMGRQGAMGGQ